METKDLKGFLDRARRWPRDAQHELIRSMTEIEARYTNIYHLDDQERAALKRSADDIQNNRIATNDDVEAVFERFHRA
jgi:hypothetical protein